MITVNMNKARELVHSRRRQVRDTAFEPLDRQATVPSLAEEAEAARVLVREEDAALQSRIDGAALEELSTILDSM